MMTAGERFGGEYISTPDRGRTDQVVIFDIDGTLSDTSGRQHHLDKTPKDWDQFFKELDQDPPIEGVVHIAKAMWERGLIVYLVTARFEKYRERTEGWLANNGVRYHKLYMRPNNDKQDDSLFKKEVLHEIGADRVLFAVEDRARVVKMWREEGVLCLQCAPGEF